MESMANTPMNTAGIILAAGLGRRMGQTKQLLDFQGKPMLCHVLDQCTATQLDPLILVLGHDAPKIQTALSQSGSCMEKIEICINPDYEKGMAASIIAGLKALESIDVGGALFLLADQPQIVPEQIHALLEAARKMPDAIIIPTFRGRRGNPVYFGQNYFNALKEIQGDKGGRALFDKFKDKIIELPALSGGVIQDVDTPEAYAQLCAGPKEENR